PPTVSPAHPKGAPNFCICWCKGVTVKDLETFAPHSHPFQSEQFCSVTVIDGAYVSSSASVRVAGKTATYGCRCSIMGGMFSWYSLTETSFARPRPTKNFSSLTFRMTHWSALPVLASD